MSEGAVAPVVAPAASPGLFREAAGFVNLTGVTVNRDRVTVPPVARLSFSATKTPANAPGVTLSVVGDSATIAAGTTVNNTTGAIRVAADQTGGSAHIKASQNLPDPPGGSSWFTAPFSFTAIPSGITSTTASPSGSTGFYGGDFTHTFTSPAGGQTALERSHLNERFASSTITGTLGSLTFHVNNPDSATEGWDLNSSGTMKGPDLGRLGGRQRRRPPVRCQRLTPISKPEAAAGMDRDPELPEPDLPDPDVRLRGRRLHDTPAGYRGPRQPASKR